jgi:hypothetical protein
MVEQAKKGFHASARQQSHASRITRLIASGANRSNYCTVMYKWILSLKFEKFQRITAGRAYVLLSLHNFTRTLRVQCYIELSLNLLGWVNRLGVFCLQIPPLPAGEIDANWLQVVQATLHLSITSHTHRERLNTYSHPKIYCVLIVFAAPLRLDSVFSGVYLAWPAS